MDAGLFPGISCAESKNCMIRKFKPVQLMYYLGVLALLAGFISPLQGSILVANGALVLTASTFLLKHRYRYYFLWGCILLVFGVVMLFFFSNKGGFGATGDLPYGLRWFMLPYPVGWLIMLITLIVSSYRKWRQLKTVKEALTDRE